MREIRFRGKRVDNGEWVYGFWGNRPDGANFICPFENYESYAVIPSTVGQYTGLKDSKYADNYEGNICKCVLNGIDTHVEEVLTEVYYDEIVGGFAHKVISKDSDYTVFGLNSKDLLSCEIIGSVFDNPELLTTQQGE